MLREEVRRMGSQWKRVVELSQQVKACLAFNDDGEVSEQLLKILAPTLHELSDAYDEYLRGEGSQPQKVRLTLANGETIEIEAPPPAEAETCIGEIRVKNSELPELLKKGDPRALRIIQIFAEDKIEEE